MSKYLQLVFYVLFAFGIMVNYNFVQAADNSKVYWKNIYRKGLEVILSPENQKDNAGSYYQGIVTKAFCNNRADVQWRKQDQQKFKRQPVSHLEFALLSPRVRFLDLFVEGKKIYYVSSSGDEKIERIKKIFQNGVIITTKGIILDPKHNSSLSPQIKEMGGLRKSTGLNNHYIVRGQVCYIKNIFENGKVLCWYHYTGPNEEAWTAEAIYQLVESDFKTPKTLKPLRAPLPKVLNDLQ